MICTLKLPNEKKWLDYDEFMKILSEVKISYVEPLFIGSLDDCLLYPEKFITHIPNLHNLPIIENNYAEGIVIKPSKPLYLSSSRIILKKKIEKFNERRSKPYKLREDTTITHKILDYITENRLHNVISKIGYVTEKDFSKLMKEYCK